MADPTHGPQTKQPAGRTLFSVTIESAAVGPHPVDMGVVPASFRWLRPLAVAVVAVVVSAAFETDPGPGTHGEHLAVTLAVAAFAAATVAAIRLPDGGVRLLTPLLGAVVVAAGTLVGLQPNGPGFLGVFPAVSAAALRLPTRLAGLIAGLAVVVLAGAWTAGGDHRPVVGIVLNEFGVAAFYRLAVFARRYREANDRAQRLIDELNETRVAQAHAAALTERQRLAREMHDVLAHSLSGLVLNLEGARILAERGNNDPQLTDTLGRAQRLAKSGLEEARRAIGMLRDDALPSPERLREVAAEFEADTGIACCVTVDGDSHEVGPDGRLTLYRVAQEALTNVRKHARPDRVCLRLAYGPSGTELTVEDHRAGGERPPPGDGTGYGLTGMRERAELLGGTLTAGPTPDGYRVALWIPA